MANSYYNKTTFIPFTLAKASDLNTTESNTDLAFDKLPNPLSTGRGFSENFKVTVAPTDKEHISRVTDIQKSSLVYGDDTTATGNNFTLSLSPTPDIYSEGFSLKFKAAKSNTGNAYLNVNGKGNVEIVNAQGGHLSGGEITKDYVCTVVYVNGKFQLLSSTSAVAPEAPNDAYYYGRHAKAWSKVVPEVTSGGAYYVRKENTWTEFDYADTKTTVDALLHVDKSNLIPDPNFIKSNAKGGLGRYWQNSWTLDTSEPSVKYSFGDSRYCHAYANSALYAVSAAPNDEFLLTLELNPNSFYNGTIELTVVPRDKNGAAVGGQLLSVSNLDMTVGSYTTFTKKIQLTASNMKDVYFHLHSVGDTAGQVYIRYAGVNKVNAQYDKNIYCYERLYNVNSSNCVTDPTMNKSLDIGGLGHYYGDITDWSLSTTGGTNSKPALLHTGTSGAGTTIGILINTGYLYLDAVAGQVWTFEVRAKVGGASAADFKVGFREFSNSETLLTTSTSTITGASLSTSYQLFTKSMTITFSSTVYIQPVIIGTSSAAGVTTYIDYVRVTL